MNTISVVMSTFNGGKFIKEQILSILNQSILPDELIIIDDGSTDDTVEQIKELLMHISIQYRLVIHKHNKGVTETFQEGIELATSDFVMLCDQDDVWKLEKIEYTKKAISDGVTLILCDAQIVDAELNLSGKTMFEYIRLPIELDDRFTTLSSDLMVSMSLRRNYSTGMCMAGKRESMINAIPIPKSMTYDAWLALCLANEGNTVIINEALVYYRQHGKNVIGTNKRKESIKQYFSHRIKDLTNLTNKYRDISTIAFHNPNMEMKAIDAYKFYMDRGDIVNRSFFQGFIWIINMMLYKKYNRYTSDARKEIFKDIGMIIIMNINTYGVK